MSSEKQYSTEITGAILTVLAGAASFGANYSGIPFEVYLPVILGFGLTISVSAVKEHVTSYLNKRDQIYSLMNQIKHDDLRLKAQEYVDECELALQDLSKGVVRLRPHEVFKSITDKMNGTVTHVQASHLAIEPSFIYVWEEVEGVKKYLQANYHAINERRVKIERVVVLRKADLVSQADGGTLDHRAISILKDQMSKGIEITVTWMEDISELDTVQDFIIFDTKEVQVNYPMGVGRYYNMALKREPKDIRQYQNAYSALKAAGQPLETLLVSLEGRSVIEIDRHTNAEIVDK